VVKKSRERERAKKESGRKGESGCHASGASNQAIVGRLQTKKPRIKCIALFYFCP
jgi:ribosome assembly protein YihI (activator of Der GTPase)